MGAALFKDRHLHQLAAVSAANAAEAAGAADAAHSVLVAATSLPDSGLWTTEMCSPVKWPPVHTLAVHGDSTGADLRPTLQPEYSALRPCKALIGACSSARAPAQNRALPTAFTLGRARWLNHCLHHVGTCLDHDFSVLALFHGFRRVSQVACFAPQLAIAMRLTRGWMQTHYASLQASGTCNYD